MTQGNMAKYAIESSFSSTIEGDLKHCGYASLNLNDRKTLWIHTYHPSYYGGFNRQRRECYHLWADVVRRWVTGQTSP